MSWTEATFRNRSGKSQRVWVETDDMGEFVLNDGRVPMRYSNAEDAKTYSASPRNLAVGDGAPEDGVREKPKKAKVKREPVPYDDNVWKVPEGARVRTEGAPAGLAHEGLPPANTIDAWTDGACTGNPGPSGYGAVIRWGSKYAEVSQYIGTGTNNIAELLAIKVALEEIENVDGVVRVHTDSTYSIGVLSKGWKAKANVELIAATRALVSQRDVEFIKVKGHAGIPLNERADDLAVAAVERRA